MYLKIPDNLSQKLFIRQVKGIVGGFFLRSEIKIIISHIAKNDYCLFSQDTEINFQIPVRVCGVRKDGRPEYFVVVVLSLYKNVTDAKLASCIQLETSLSTDVFIRTP